MTLHGWYIPSTNSAAVILTHAFNGNRTGTMPLSQACSQVSPTPIFLISAEGDLGLNQACFDAANEPKNMWRREETGHRIDALFDCPNEYEQRVIGFLDQALLQDN